MKGRRPTPVELAVPALLAFGGAVEIAAAAADRWAVGISTYVLAACCVALARRIPLALPLVAAALYAAAALGAYDVSQPVAWLLLLGVAMLAAGLHVRPARRLMSLASVLAALGLMYATLAWLTPFEPSIVFGLALTVGPWGLGTTLRAALERERRTAAEAERARLELDLARERAVAEERGQIAAELEDLLAHALGAMTVQAAVAADAVGSDAHAATRILETIAHTGRGALEETGRLLRILRVESTGPPASRASASAEHEARLGPRDALLPGLFAVVTAIEIGANGYGPLPVLLGACLLACALLAARRVAPLAMPAGVAAVLLGAGAVGADAGELASSIPIGGLAFFAAGRHASRPGLGLAAAASGLALLLADTLLRGGLSADAAIIVLFAFAAWGIGAATLATLARTRRLAAEAERARLDAGAETARAVFAERRRVARDLHDVLARSLSVMTVQAALAAELVAADRHRAVAAVEEIQRAGRAALEDTGQLLQHVRGGGEDGMRPQPGVADLAQLAEEYGRAGLAVELQPESLGSVPAGLEVSVYRIVQEALTNAIKHAPGSSVRVRLARTPSAVAVEIANGPPSGAGRPPVPSGHGLTGLRERVAVFGGELETRSTPDGGFLLAATMPVPETE